MNERDSKMIYRLKKEMIDAIRKSVKYNVNTSPLEKIISDAVETFLHPPEKGK